jgi:tetratricopeptide (TPR) repeat protein
LTLRGASKHQFNPQATRATREDLEEAIRLDPNYSRALAYLAWINLTDLWNQLTGEWYLSRIDEVVSQFRRAIELDPNLAKGYAGLGQAMRTKGDLTQALALSYRAVELGPSDPDNLLFLAVTLFETGDLKAATKTIEQALELHPLRPSYYSFFHAMILWANKRFQEALEEADECLRKAPQFFAAEVYRTLALVGLGRIAEAKTQLKGYLSRTAGPPIPPCPPELASRFLAGLKSAGWRPSVATERAAG